MSLRQKQVSELNLKGITSIVHLAGKAHEMKKIDPRVYFQVNRDLTLQLAEKAKNHGVEQFVFISTVKVYGDINNGILDETSICNPTDPYGKSKYEAEQGLKKIESEGFKVTIIRPPLIYGKGVKGNLYKLMELIRKTPLLPFNKIDNLRSMVYVQNLIFLIKHLIENQNSGTFIAGDRKPHSTSELVIKLKKQLDSKALIFAFPLFVIFLLKKIKPQLAERLYGSFIIDNTNTNNKLNFQPPFSFEQGIEEMAAEFLKTKK